VHGCAESADGEGWTYAVPHAPALDSALFGDVPCGRIEVDPSMGHLRR